MSKILILTASPVRDKYVDELIASKLRVAGHDVWVRPCLRQGRDSVLELEPDVVVVPPIRNPYSRDFVGTLKRWGCGVVTRHTEPSCSWQDWKKMDEKQRQEIMGRWSYIVDAELVWSQDEAEILKRRNCPFPVIPVGACNADVYKNAEMRARLRNVDAFRDKYKFARKKTLLIASAWGFADSAPDLHIDDIDDAKEDNESRDRHLEMARACHKALKTWNILVTCHPGVMQEPYKKLCEDLDIPLDTESTMIEMLINSDALIHSGSNSAISAHHLDIPAFQYGDINAKSSNSWWGMPECAISRVSPHFKTPDKLIAAVKRSRRKSNANRDTLKELETGRYGLMDGMATKRVAEVITKIRGKFKMCWPEATEDYTQKGAAYRRVEECFQPNFCGVCKHTFLVVKDYIASGQTNLSCPWCAARAIMKGT